MKLCFDSVRWRYIDIKEVDILLLLNDYYFNDGKIAGLSNRIEQEMQRL